VQTTRTIYVDMDDVLCETARGCIAIIEREFGIRVTYEQLLNFDLGKACALGASETAELYRIVHRPDELLKLEPIDGAIPVLKQWLAAGYEIAIVTGRPPVTLEPSLEWLARREVPYHSFTVVDKYGRFATENTSAVTLSELASHRFSFAIEDSPTMAKYLAETMDLPVKLYDRPWNRSGIEHAKITRHSHWREIGSAFSNGLACSK
jgi:uncharacterized HAD superfamily protein